MSGKTDLISDLKSLLYGFGAILYIPLLPFLLLLSYEANNVTGIWPDIVEVFIQQVTLAVGLMYLFRILFWGKEAIPTLWNRYTPPFNQTSKLRLNVQAESPKKIQKSEKKFWNWLIMSAGTGLFSIIAWKINDSLSRGSTFDINTQFGTTLELARQLITELPVFKQLDILYSILPGETGVVSTLYLLVSIPLTICFRNLVFIFENSTMRYRSLSGTPNQAPVRSFIYGMILLLSKIMGALILIFILIIIIVSIIA